MANEDEKRVIALYGEMRLAMDLHSKGWQVYRAYIDEHIDFVISKYYCTRCKKFSTPKRKKLWKKNKQTNVLEVTDKKFPIDSCAKCNRKSLKFIVRFLQVKTSAGVIPRNKKGLDKRSNIAKKSKILDYSFHAKLRSNIDERSFYVWIATTEKEDEPIPHPYFYIFQTNEVRRFDNITIDSYQKTDNQKTTLKISPDGHVHNKGRKYKYSCFNKDFRDNFKKLEKLLKVD